MIFLRVFGGFDTPGHLPFGVYSFFQNGGRCCYVVRTAHMRDEGAAQRASFSIKDKNGKEIACLRSKSEGVWGNQLFVNLWITSDLSGDKKSINLSLHEGTRQEDFLGLSPDPRDEDFYLRKIQRDSFFVDVTGGGKDGALPCEIYNVYFMGGKEGVAGLTPGDFIGRTISPAREQVYQYWKYIRMLISLRYPIPVC